MRAGRHVKNYFVLLCKMNILYKTQTNHNFTMSITHLNSPSSVTVNDTVAALVNFGGAAVVTLLNFIEFRIEDMCFTDSI